MGAARVGREDRSCCATEGSAVEFASLRTLGCRRVRIADEIRAPAIAGNIKYRTALQTDDVIELEPANKKISGFRHAAPETPTSADWQIVNIRERKAMPDIRVRTAALKLRSGWIIGTAISGAGPIRANAAGGIIDGVGPGIGSKNRQALGKAFLELALHRVVTGATPEASSGDCSDTGNFARAGPAFIITGANILLGFLAIYTVIEPGLNLLLTLLAYILVFVLMWFFNRGIIGQEQGSFI